jgi:macrolide transport system ATP-binding/permease protein
MKEAWRRLGWLLRRDRFEREFEEEIRHHLALSGGDETARRRFGNITLIKEESRAMWTFAFWEQFAQDIRYGLRAMLANKLFTAMAVLSLALGIGANTAIYSFMDAIMLRALPVQHPERLVVLNWHARIQPPVIHAFYGGGHQDPKTGFTSGNFPYPAFELFSSNRDLPVDLFGFDTLYNANLLFRDQAELASGQYVSGGYFTGLGVIPEAGRLIGPDDDRTGAPPVAVLGDGYWRSRFGADPAVVGQTVIVNNVQYVIAGVAAPEFYGTDPAIEAKVFLPLHAETEADRFTDGRFYWLSVMGRLHLDARIATAQAPLAAAFHQFAESTATDAKTRRDMPELLLQEGGSGIDSLRRQYSEPLRILMAMVGLILTIACANIASLLLSRASARRREIAVRLSLGAGRWRIIRQLLTESLLLSLGGGTLAVLVALPGIQLINGLLTRGNRNLNLHVSLDWRVFVFTLVLAFAAGITFGLAPAFQATKVDVAPTLKGIRSATSRRRFFGLGHALVVAQIALSLLLVIGAGLFVRTLSNLESINLGFNRENVLLFSLVARKAGYSDEALVRLYESLRTQLAAVPGVRRVSLSDMALVSGNMSAGGVSIPGMEGARTESSFMSVGPGFFSTMGIPLAMGREIGERDAANSEKVAVVNEVFAKNYFGTENPLGRQIGIGKIEFEIVGVAKTARYDSLKRDIPPVVYTAYTQRGRPMGQVVYELRTEGKPLSLANTVRRIVAEAAPRVPMFNVTTQSDQIDETISQELTFADLCTAFAALALIIACVGIYGLLAYAVSRRTNEIGIRMALGAQRQRIVWMVLREALVLCAAGLTIGLVCAWSAASVIKSFLFGMKPADPMALGTAVVLLVAVAALAGYAPAWRASRIDPMVALRHE